MEKKLNKGIGTEEIKAELKVDKSMKAKGMEVKIKFSPTITLYMGKEKLGSIKFDGPENMGEFTNHLGKLLKGLVKDYNSGKK